MKGWETILERARTLSVMARRRSKNYKQVVTGTKDMGITGAQIHIGKVTKLDPALKSGFLKNVVVSCMYQELSGSPTISHTALPAFTVYLSNNSNADGWSDDAVLAARSTSQGGGNVSLSANRIIRTDETASDSSLGPVHVWAEMTDVPGYSGVGFDARYTIEAWGRMVILTGDF